MSTLIVTEGKLKGKEFVFSERTTYSIGRSENCNLKLPSDQDHKEVSRASDKIGQRQRNMTAPQAPNTTKSLHKLKNGDEIQVGNTVLKVVIEVDSNESKTENISAVQEPK